MVDASESTIDNFDGSSGFSVCVKKSGINHELIQTVDRRPVEHRPLAVG